MTPDPLLMFPARACCRRPLIVPLSHVCLRSVATDSDSEPSLSGCETAGHLYEDEEDFRSELYCSISSNLSGRMSQDDRRAEEEDDDEVDGGRKHRWEYLKHKLICARYFLRNNISYSKYVFWKLKVARNSQCFLNKNKLLQINMRV